MTRITRSSAAIATATALGILSPTVAQAAPTSGSLALTENPGTFGSTKTAPVAMTYQVKAGDTVSEIALRTGTTVSAIIKANGLNSRALIFPGQKLSIPAPASAKTSSATAAKPATTTKKSSTKPAPAKAQAAKVHVVQTGDTLGGIAAKNSVSVATLVKLNSLANPNRIYVGQRIVITKATASTKSTTTSAPKTNSAPAKPAATTYTVKPGDTLGAIARAHSTTVAAISKANGITNPNRIAVGQKLTIGATATAAPKAEAPKAEPRTEAARTSSATQATTYTVQRGDTLSGISAKFGVPVDEITATNNIANANAIWVGQRLTIGGTVKAAESSRTQLVTNNFPGYTYSDVTVAAANQNKYALIDKAVPTRAEVQAMVRQTAIEMGVDPKLALAHAYVESGFDATAVSPANAIGTMQVIPSSGVWASQLVGRPLDLLDPQDNIVAGIAIIRSLHNSTSNFDHAVGGYYQGLGGVQRYGMRSDTVAYVAKIKNAMARF